MSKTRTEYLIHGRWVRVEWFKGLAEATREVEELTPTVEKNEAGHEAQKMMNVLRVFNQQGLEEALKYYPEYRPVLLRIHQMLTPTVAAATVAPVAEDAIKEYHKWREALEKAFDDSEANDFDDFREGAEWARQHFEQQLQSLQAENQRLREQVQDLQKKNDWLINRR